VSRSGVRRSQDVWGERSAVVADAQEGSERAMQMQGQALAGSTQSLTTKRGETLQKTKLKVIDLGPEASGGDVYWVDFLGDDALTDEELRQVMRQQVMIEIRRFSTSVGKQQPVRAYLNATGGAVRLNGQVVQRALRTQAVHSVQAGQTGQARAS
jgi:hypothetical protein